MSDFNYKMWKDKYQNHSLNPWRIVFVFYIGTFLYAKSPVNPATFCHFKTLIEEIKIIMKKKFLQSAFLLAALSLAFVACKKNDAAPPAPTVVKEWTIPLAAKFENTPPAGRTETGTANLQLLSDNSIKYTITITGLASGDALNAAHIHTGDVITNGGVIVGFNPTFTGSTATGTVTGLRPTFVDSLKDNMNELYFNVHSTQVPGGLVRGQLNTNIEMAEYVTLSGINEVPAVTTSATGIALLRLTSDKKLYSKIIVSNLEPGDVLNAAHLHKAAAGANAGVFLGLYGSGAEFGTTKIITLTDAAIITSLKTDAMYVNAHSTAKPGGIIRGQVR